MYLKQMNNKKTGRTFLSIAQKYRDPIKKTSTDRTIVSLGYLDELKKEYSDPIAHFKEVAFKMTEEENSRKLVTLSINMDEQMEKNTNNRKNFGYAAILKVYHELQLNRFLNNKARHKNFEYNTNSIMILLVISRLLYPGSKKKAFEEKDQYFERFNFSLDDIYRALSHYSAISKELQQYLHENIVLKYGCNTKTIYYDVTNYYFEIDKPDEKRKHGKAKQNRNKPIVQMGLAMDSDGIPLHYEIFPGNKLDKNTFRSVIGEVRRNYNTGRIVVVADMGIITGDNIYYLTGGKKEKPLNGYVFSYSIRGGTDEIKKYVLNETCYTDKEGRPVRDETDFKIKSKLIVRAIKVTMANGKKQTKTVYEKLVVFWSKKYFDKARAERAEVIKKAMDLIENPEKYTKATSYGAAAYVTNINFDKNTGQVIESEKIPKFRFDKLEEEEKYDGYYSIVTSELKMSNEEIIDTYRGLWEIEETLKITKSELETPPVHVRTDDHIDAHFLTCFIALTIIRIIQRKTNRKYSPASIIDCLKKISCTLEENNIYIFDYRSEISDTIGELFDIDFSRRRLRRGEIKKILGATKK